MWPAAAAGRRRQLPSAVLQRPSSASHQRRCLFFLSVFLAPGLDARAAAVVMRSIQVSHLPGSCLLLVTNSCLQPGISANARIVLLSAPIVLDAS